MKIGIITFHNSIDYGSILQSWALQKELKLLGEEPIIINYKCVDKLEKDKAFILRKDFKENIQEVKNFIYKLNRNRKMYSFMKREYVLTKKKYKYLEEMESLEKEFPLFICGSDEIWNYNSTKLDTAYFLNFIRNSKKKVAYGASFAMEEINKSYKFQYKNLLNSIEYISVRENSGKKLIKEIIDRDSTVVLDPTLLLNKNQWMLISSDEYKNTRVEEKYILLYTLNNSPEIINYAKYLKRLFGYKLIKVCTSSWDYKNSKDRKGEKGYESILPSPKEFLNLINRAECIITDSFYGVAFSINFNKPFYVYLGEEYNRRYLQGESLTQFNNSEQNSNDEANKDEINNVEVNKVQEASAYHKNNFTFNNLQSYKEEVASEYEGEKQSNSMELDKNSNDLYKYSSICNLLETFSLEERIITSLEILDRELSIDYSTINKELSEEREKSVGFLKDILNKSKNLEYLS